jgi:hypothetical protein
MRARHAFQTFSCLSAAVAISAPVAAAGAQGPLVLVPARVHQVMPEVEQRRTVPLSAPPGARVVSTPEDGGRVRLADGTLWEVYLPDRTATVVWRRGDYVAVSRAPTAVDGYDHLLVNGAARTRALVRFVGFFPPRRR